jgi:hypothetical protein
MLRIRSTIATVVLVAAASWPAVSFAQAPAIEYDHAKDDADRAYELRLNDRQTFNIVIRNTCEEAFSYEVQGILRQSPSPAGASVSAGVPLKDKTIPVTHDDQFGGYIVRITRTLDKVPCTGGEKLQSRTLVIATPLIDWDLAFSGGFTVSTLTNPVFYLRPHPTEAGRKQVQQDADAEDSAHLGIGTFVHLYHHRRPWASLMFGLGLREGNKTEYFIGGGYRFSDKATLNAGLALGPVSRLPAGVDTTGPVADDNVLTNLQTRTRAGVFVAISYSFINVRDRLQKPFAGGTSAPAAASTPAPAASTPAAGACATVTLTPNTLTFAQAGTPAQNVKVVPPNETCTWKVEPLPGFVHMSVSAGPGTQTIAVSMDPNDTTTARNLKISVGPATLALTQAAKP